MIDVQSAPVSNPSTHDETPRFELSAEDHVRGLLRHIGEDPQREGLVETPQRVIKAMAEHFAGYREDPALHLQKTFEEVEGYSDMVMVSDIPFHSHCEHHMVPFLGKAHVAYIPNGRVVGISKLARVVDGFAKRLQVQEKLTAQITDAIERVLQPKGVAVTIQAQHFCMCYRGISKPGAWTTTKKFTGLFREDRLAREEYFQMLSLERNLNAAG